MNWNRQDLGMKNTSIYVNILIIICFFSFLFKQYAFLSLFSFLLMIALVQVYYYRKVGEKLELLNGKKRVRLMKDTTSHIVLNFQNKGLPIWNGTLLISFQTSIEPNGIANTTIAGFHDVRVPFTIGYKKEVTLKIPIKGVHRGLARIKEIEIQIPHPLTDGSVLLEYKPFILMDAIVYPQIYPIDDELTPSKFKQGSLELNSSLFDDPFFPVGTRQYEQGDQFHHIHWKASAKTQELQTKVFTKVADVSVLFVVNLKEKFSVVSDFEEKIEWLASHIDACYKKDIPFSFAINIRAYGKYPFVYLPIGSGDTHRILGLEILSILSVSDILIPFEKMIAFIDTHEELPVAVYIMTHDLNQFLPSLIPWEQRTNVWYPMDLSIGGV
ncbi:DUF58 domain-containing protein [Psychrobacillus glaciei]|uniref:DUF58 domain-containing protein n=1 Tax=Psychrobacillus glaciei TaxID=2283160 RepID=A0A5J6SK64_9BACI|nr:DUF58 domain-containing protein [Psychrobacillus glaciei]QFF98291.1 DUF58 domain-containing protein [Psychrobacillus glaciei]